MDPMSKLLSREDILEALGALAAELEARRLPTDLLVGGGAALVLLYAARQATRDVDAFVFSSADPTSVRQAASEIADRLRLPEDWLNDGAKGYLHGLEPGEILFQRPFLTVRAIGVQQLLAMKLSAWRDDVDISDARLLLSKLTGDRSRIWSSIEPYLVPGRELKARYAFEDLWELDHGPS
jgi:predicted nucleotidyltransferase